MVRVEVSLLAFQAKAFRLTNKKTTAVRMAKPKSELIFLTPNFANTEVKPAKNVAKSAYTNHCGKLICFNKRFIYYAIIGNNFKNVVPVV